MGCGRFEERRGGKAVLVLGVRETRLFHAVQLAWSCLWKSFNLRSIREPQLLLILAALLIFIHSSPSQEPKASPLAPGVITNLSSFWGSDQAENALPHRIQAEFLIYFFDSSWRVVWGEFAGEPAFLPIYDAPQPFRSGQRLWIDGVVIPAQQKFLWDQTKVEVLDPSVVLKPIPASRRVQDFQKLNLRYVELEGLGDWEDTSDPNFLKLGLVADGMQVTALVQRGPTNQPMPFFIGSYLRVRGVYLARANSSGKIYELSLWVSGPKSITTVGSLNNDPRFSGPAVAVEDLRTTKNPVKVTGTVRNHDRGKGVVLWDATGQVRVETPQMLTLQVGDRVEALGIPVIEGLEATLQDAIYRVAADTNGVTAVVGTTRLRLAAQVRDLRQDQMAEPFAVSLQGVVSWSHKATPFLFLSDSSGGVRVVHPKLEGVSSLLPKMMVRVEGLSASGDFVSVVTNAVVRPTGVAEFPEARPVSLEQAMTGVEDGNWVEMRGYLRRVSEEGGLTRLELSTWGGDFQACVPNDKGIPVMTGAIVRLQGICGSLANERRQLTGIELWIPDSQFVQVETAMPADVFTLPERSLGSLRQFSAFNALNQRVRTRGTVVLSEPGRNFQVQDGKDSVFVLSRQTTPLQPGDRVEVVGFPGNDGRRFLLREAVYRVSGSGPEPDPVRLGTVGALGEQADGLLVRAEGVLLELVPGAGEASLLLQSHQTVFEAHLDVRPSTQQIESLPVGSRLSLAGVCQVQRDDYGKARGYVIHLRTWDDLQVLRRPPWWTFTRLVWVLSGVLIAAIVALGWAGMAWRKNRLLRNAQAELQLANEQLETRVAERTDELEKQVLAKERAHARLAETQLHLMQASRLAGMAEVATGVLHNVGNVLNSVGVSASLVGEQLRRSKITNLQRATTLLRDQNSHLAEFLTNDPKGKLLPEYLGTVADQLAGEQANLIEEMNSVGEHIEHIKEIVAMQQTYAKVSGAYENLPVRALVEDALRMNAAAFARHRVQVIREFAVNVPEICVDRHKVLQILINLFSNAKYAMQGQETHQKRLVIRTGLAVPDRVQITVSDNGVGIASENLIKIFSHGFTTKKDGHGFGLHSGANAAKEMGGSLTAHSDGIGRGATFTLELPAATGGSSDETGLKAHPGDG